MPTEKPPRDWLNDFTAEALATMQRQVDETLAETLSRSTSDDLGNLYDDLWVDLVEDVDLGSEWALRAVMGLAKVNPDETARELWKPMAVAILRATKALRFDAHRLPTQRPPVLPGPHADALAQLAALRELVESQGKAKHASTLGDAISEYERLQAAGSDLRGETLSDNVAKLKRFADAIGAHRELDDIRPSEIRTYLAGLADKSGKPLASSTKKLHGSKIEALYSFAIEREWATRNPAKRTSPRAEQLAHDARRAFTSEQLRSIFGQELIDASRGRGAHRDTGKERAERLWVPLLMLTMGARPNEVGQLLLGEIVERDGFSCVAFDPQDETGERRVKNLSSRRVVPIPQVLIDLGLMNYVAARRSETDSAPDALLFPALAFHKRNGYAARVISWFSGADGFLNRVGVKDERLSLYSCRHTAITRLRAAGVGDIERTDITGHARSGDQGKVTYISRTSVADMKSALDRVDWTDVLGGLRGLLGR